MLSKKISLFSRATELSLKNAEQWIKDAKLLIENLSFGHASALLRFSCEEIAKAYVCWFTSEKMWPIENKVVRDIFRDHLVKNEVMLGLLFTAMWISKHNLQELTERRFEPSDEDIIEAYEEWEDIVVSTEKMRQKAIYVDVNVEKEEVETPLTISEKEVRSILTVTEVFLKMVKYYVEEFPETKKEILREIFSSIPIEAWKMGEIPIDWFQRDKDEWPERAQEKKEYP